MSTEAPMRVVIVGAGLAGLSAAYAIRALGGDKIQVRILERRKKDSPDDQGYPIHLSKSGREALDELLSPSDRARLDAAREEMPLIHDGVTVASTKKIVWRMTREPGARCLVERAELLRILRGGSKVEYGKLVREITDCGSSVDLMCADGESIEADFVIGADGMFSSIRRSILPKVKFDRLPYVIINLRSSSPATLALIPDKRGMNLLYGTGWSVASGFTSKDTCYIALTIAAPADDTRTAVARYAGVPLIDALLQDQGLAEAKAYPLNTARRTVVGKGRIALIGDAAHGMVPFCGAGASSGVTDGTEIAKVLVGGYIEDKVATFNKNMVNRTDTLIYESSRLLWLAQGDKAYKRIARRVAFAALEIGERLGDRKRMDAELALWVDNHEDEKQSL